MKKKICFIFFGILLWSQSPFFLLGQQGSDIFLFQVALEGEKLVLSQPVKVSRTVGYNNQPFFHPDGTSLFYSSGEGTNTDIYLYTFGSGSTTRLTDTPDSEYSPTVMPGGERFSVIQLVTTEGPRNGAQPLVAFPIKGGQPELIYEEGEKVGYHAWIDSDTLAMFLLGSPNFLQIVNLKTMNSRRVAENIGRSLYKIPGQNAISFSVNVEDGPGLIKKYDLKTQTTETIIPLLEGNSFYAWTPSGLILMGVGSNLYGFHPQRDTEWQLIQDLAEAGVRNITRLAVHPKIQWLAIVNNQ